MLFSQPKLIVCIVLSFAVHSLSFSPICSRLSFIHSQRLSSTVDDKLEVEEYFNNEGFSRWNKIYSESSEVNSVQKDIRTGHQQTIDKVIGWLSTENNRASTLCDAGCGVGSLALPLSSSFQKIFASDISKSMTEEASRRAKEANVKNIEFKVSDMEKLNGKYNTVTCIDVMIHYPTDKVIS
jgi:magnesium-protoporphyrin O-methyltransferase